MRHVGAAVIQSANYSGFIVGSLRQMNSRGAFCRAPELYDTLTHKVAYLGTGNSPSPSDFIIKSASSGPLHTDEMVLFW